MVDKLIDEGSRGYASGVGDDEIIRFLRSTTFGDKKADPLLWWRLNGIRVPSLSELARSVLAILASFMASESMFSVAGDIKSPNHSALSDKSVSSGILPRP